MEHGFMNNLSEVIKADEDLLIRDAPRLVPDDVLERPIPRGGSGRAGWTPKSGVATSAQSTVLKVGVALALVFASVTFPNEWALIGP